jgi:hypothetical protein
VDYWKNITNSQNSIRKKSVFAFIVLLVSIYVLLIYDQGSQHNSKCNHPCLKTKDKCSQNHKCLKLCHQICDDCDEIIEEIQLICGHKATKIKCSQIDTFDCMKKCNRYFLDRGSNFFENLKILKILKFLTIFNN